MSWPLAVQLRRVAQEAAPARHVEPAGLERAPALEQRHAAAPREIALHIQFTRPTYLFQTYARRWLDHYSAAGMVVHDPTVHWGFHNIGCIRWTDLEAIDAGGVLESAKDFGIMNGVTVSVYMSGSRSIASFARADRDYDEPEMQDLEDLLAQLHRATINPDSLGKADRKALTELSIKLTH
jgi:LuxR family transcriptional regulator